MIYLDNSATTLKKPDKVSEYMIKALGTFGNGNRGAYEYALNSSRIIYNTREELGNLFNIDNPFDIAFTSNATEALNTAIFGIIEKNDHVITTVCEHNSVLRPLYYLEKKGVELSFLPIDDKHNICYNNLKSMCKKNTKAIVITGGSNVTGNITNIKLVSDFAKSNNIILIVDGAQIVGNVPIDVKKTGIDVLCFSGHKGLLGPQGTGGIYVNPKIKIKPLKMGGSGSNSFLKTQPQTMPTLLEAGTLNSHSIAGLYGALEYIKKNTVEKLNDIENNLSSVFYNGIKDIKNVVFYGDYQANKRLPIVSFNILGIDSQIVTNILYEDYDICVRGGIHCAPLIHKSLNTQSQGIVRFSFSHFNTDEEIKKSVHAVREIAKGYES